VPHPSIKSLITINVCSFLMCCVSGIQANEVEDEVLALADQALARISAEDTVGLTDLMLDDATMYSSAFRDGEYHVRRRDAEEERNTPIEVALDERGFDPVVHVSGPIAMVWYPYDIYVDGEWSHCGVDIFNLVRTNDGWRIAALVWSVEQPPACRKHPAGPPGS